VCSSDLVLVEILKGDGELVESNEIIARIDTKAAAKAAPAEAEPQQQSLSVDAPQQESPKLSPAVRNLLEEHKLDAARIPLQGDNDRLTKEDVLRYLQNNKATAPAAEEVSTPTEAKTKVVVEPEAGPAPAPIPSGARPEERVAMTRLRKRTAERLLLAQHDNALLTTFNEVDMTAVMELRKKYKELFEKKHGVKLGFMGFFTKAVCHALEEVPAINAEIDGNELIYKHFCHIGVAVGTEKGLVVPVVRNADQMSIAGIEQEIGNLGRKARDGDLSMSEMQGGTFTISNGGVYGSLMSTPILNAPQSGILGMHKIQPRPIAMDGAVVIRPMMYLALSYDHRIVDGKEAVTFLVRVKESLEDPERLVLDL